MRSKAFPATSQVRAANWAPWLAVAALLAAAPGQVSHARAADEALEFAPKALDLPPISLLGGMFTAKPHGIEPMRAEPFHSRPADPMPVIVPKAVDPRMPVKAPDASTDFKLTIVDPDGVGGR